MEVRSGGVPGPVPSSRRLRVRILWILAWAVWVMVPMGWMGDVAAAPKRSSQLVSVSGEGTAQVLNNNFAYARDRAVNAALRKSLSVVLSTLVDPVEFQKNGPQILDRLTTKDFRFIHSYKFLNEWVDEETGIYRVTLQVNVAIDGMQGALSRVGISSTWSGKPKILILIDERTMSTFDEETFLLLPSSSEKEFVKTFQDQGYTVMDRRDLEQFQEPDLVVEAVGGDVGAAADLGKRFGAKLVLTGKTQVSIQSDAQANKGIQEVQAKIHVYLVQVNPAKLVTDKEKTFHLVPKNVTTGTFAISRQAGKELSETFVEPVQQVLGSGGGETP